MGRFSVNAAVAGAGFIGPVHVEALRRLGVRITGILGCNEAESQEACTHLGLDRSYSSYEEMLSDPEVGAIHLAVPNVHHYAMAKEALAAGKHVLCEKPLAMTGTEAAELVELATGRDLAAAVCYNIRYYPLNIEARDRVRQGEIGTIYTVNGSYRQDWLLYEHDYNWRVLAEQGGELRAVADIGTHWMDLITSITGLEVEAVFADLKTVHPVRLRPRGEVKTFTGRIRQDFEREPIVVTTEDYGCVLLRFRGGARGCFHVSQVAAGRKNRLEYEIGGSRMSLAWESENPDRLWLGHRSQPNEILIRDPALLGDTARNFTNFPGGHNEGFPDSFKQCFRAFYEYIDRGDFTAEPTFPTFAEGKREVELCEAILRSHREQCWISV